MDFFTKKTTELQSLFYKVDCVDMFYSEQKVF